MGTIPQMYLEPHTPISNDGEKHPLGNTRSRLWSRRDDGLGAGSANATQCHYAPF